MDKELPVSAWPEWKIIEKIGEGSFGKVYKAQRTERGKSFYSAIKIINIPGSQSELNSVRSETGDEQSTRQYFRIWLRNVSGNQYHGILSRKLLHCLCRRF